MHSKRRYKIYIWATWDFSKLQGPQYYFPENFRCNVKFYESENFSDSFLHRLFESENFRFPFPMKKKANLGTEMWKIIEYLFKSDFKN